ncbi:MAG TPA: universal stress protein [Chthoniobacter sp.]|jgi:nucleotide-binding universal stress UspA family protein
MKTIIALVDFSDVTPQVVEQAALHARTYGATLILLHVVPSEPAVVEFGIASPTLLQPPSEGRIENDYNQLLNLRDSLANSGVQVSAQQLEQSDVIKLLDLCHSLEADLIVVGTHHHSTLYQFFLGTYTADVLKRAKCPVLVVPPGASASA